MHDSSFLGCLSTLSPCCANRSNPGSLRQVPLLVAAPRLLLVITFCPASSLTQHLLAPMARSGPWSRCSHAAECRCLLAMLSLYMWDGSFW